jgi:hypothetical protein
LQSEDFASDVTRAACLKQQEGFEFHFIHKSVVEFHSASFIRHSSEGIARRYYAAMDSRKWHKWRRELVFPSQIDRVRYLRYFYVPSAVEAMKYFDFEMNDVAARIVAGEPTAVTSALVRRDGQSWAEVSP